MLVVNPLQRITVAEIRQDPWFVKDLPEYLRPPKEEFFNTGVDLATIAKNARAQTAGTNQDGRRPPAMHDRGLHESVLGRLGKTMGYATDDVHDALSKKEPNPIKDAYMLVRENQMILNNCKLLPPLLISKLTPPSSAKQRRRHAIFPRPIPTPLDR